MPKHRIDWKSVWPRFLAYLFSFASFFMVYSGLQNGEVTIGRGGSPMERSEEPFSFWLAIVILTGAALWLFYAAFNDFE